MTPHCSHRGSADVVSIPVAVDRTLIPGPRCTALPSITSAAEERSPEAGGRVSWGMKNVVISWDRICYLWTNGTITSIGGPTDDNGGRDVFDGIRLLSLSVSCQKFLGADVCGQCQIFRSQHRIAPLELRRADGICHEQDLSIAAVYACENGTVILHRTDSLISVGELQQEDCILHRPLSGDLRVKSVSCGKHHALLVSAIGLVFSFGNGSQGQLGHGTIASEPQPRMLEALEGITIVEAVAGGWHSMALSDIGDLYIWGWNERGQLGFPCRNLHSSRNDSGIRKRNQPKLGSSLDKSCLQSNNCSSESDDKASGVNSGDDFVNLQPFPQLLDLPTCDPSESFICKIGCGSRHSVAVLEDGRAFSWGFNDYGQLGHGDTISRDFPEVVDFFLESRLYVKDVFCGFWNTVFVIQNTNVSDASNIVRE